MLSDLNDLQILTGILTIIYIIIDFLVGFLFFGKIKKTTTQKRIMFMMGFFVITLSSPWWPVAIQFIIYSAFDIIMDAKTYLFLTYWLVPLGMILWLWVVYEMVYYKNKKYLAFFIWSVISCIVFYIFIMINLFINTPLIGSKEGYMNVTFGPLALYLSMYGLTINLISAGIFFYKSRISNPGRETKLKSIFMFLGFIFFTFSAIFQTIPLTEAHWMAVLLKVTAISSALCFYFLFFLPKILKKQLKEE